MKTVALQISQSPRTIRRCLPSILRLVNTELYRVVPFLYLWSNELTNDDIKWIEDIAGPHVELSPSIDFSKVAEKLEHLPKRDQREGQTAAMLSSTYAVFQCNQMRHNSGINCDWIISVRPDIEFRSTDIVLPDEPLVDTLYLPTKAHYSGWNSQMALMSSDVADIYSYMHWYMRSMYLDNNSVLNHEAIVQQHMSKYNIQRCDIDIDYKIIRKYHIDTPYDLIGHHTDRDSGDL